MSIRLIAGLLLCAWMLLILFGKSGFAHLLLLNAVALIVLEAVGAYRCRVRK